MSFHVTPAGVAAVAETVVFGSIIILVAALWLGLLWYMSYKMFRAVFGLLIAPFVALKALLFKAKATEPGQGEAAAQNVPGQQGHVASVTAQDEFLDFEPTDVAQFESADALSNAAEAALASESIPARAEVSPATEATTAVAAAAAPESLPVVAAVSDSESKKNSNRDASLEARLVQEFDAMQLPAAA